MCKKMTLTLPICPSVNSYNKMKITRSGRRLTIHSYPSLETEKFYKEAEPIVREAMSRYGWETIPKGQFVVVSPTFYMKKAGSDADNHFKCLNDVLQKAGLVENDSQIIPRCDNVFIDKDNPRIELRIEVTGKIGVFNDKSEKLEFIEKNCKLCSKNYDKCTVFKGFVDNRTHDLERKDVCKKIKIKKSLKRSVNHEI